MLTNKLGKYCGAALLAASLFGVSSTAMAAQAEAPTASADGELAQQMEQLKQQVLKLNRDLFILEEDLLFPASTQVAVFVSVDIGKFFRIDSVELKINDKQVAGALYTPRQRQALEQGGIQRLYIGNIKTGQHQLDAIFSGYDNENRPIRRAASYQFDKAEDAVMLELKLSDNTAELRGEVLVEEWVL